MAVFTDDFERPDGGVGNNWQGAGASTIVSGRVNAVGSVEMLHPDVQEPDWQEVTATVYVGVIADAGCGPMVKASLGDASGYAVAALGTMAVPSWRIYRQSTQGGTTALSAVAGPALAVGLHTVSLRWEGGLLTLTVDGYLISRVAHSEWAANTCAGFRTYANPGYLEAITIAGGGDLAFVVEPTNIYFNGGPTQMQGIGQGTAWIPGIPGSTTLTSSRGVLSDQETTGPGSISFTLDPGGWVGWATITESQYRLTTQVYFSPVQVSEGGQFSQTAVEYIERSAVTGDVPTILNQAVTLPEIEIPSGPREAIGWLYRALANLVDPQTTPVTGSTWTDDVYARVWGGEEWIQANFAPPGTNSLKTDLVSLLTQIDQIRTIHDYTLGDMLTLIKGGQELDITELWVGMMGEAPYRYTSIMDGLSRMTDGAGHSIANIEGMLDLLTNAGAQDIDTILTAITGTNTGMAAGFTAIQQLLAAIRGGEDVNLKFISDWVAANGQSLYDLLGKMNLLTTNDTISLQTILDNIGGGGGGNIQPVLDAIAALRGDNASTVKAVQDSLSAYRTGTNYTVQHILDAINRIPEGSTWSTPALALLLLLLLLGLGAPEAIAVAAGGAGAAGIIALILAELPEIVGALGAIWNWWRRAAEWRSVPTAPAFPGIERVEWLPPTPFTDSVRVVGPMDGAVIRISVPGKAPYAITMGEETRFARLGVFSFQSEETAYEHIQPIQFLAQLATPKAMDNAIALLVQCKPGTEGTVTPYRLTYPGPWPFQGIHLPL